MKCLFVFMDETRSNCSMINPTSLHKTKLVRLQRRKGIKSFGFSIRGGKEHGVGIFISEVDSGSESEIRGLKVGDEILRVNGYSLQDCIHKDVLKLFRIHNDLTLLIKRIGLIPVKEHEALNDESTTTNPHKDDELTWKFVDPTPDLKKTSLESSPSIGEGIEMKIFVDMDGHSGLGCSICKGPKEKPGLFVQSIKDGGLAQQVGLHIGDQIMQVNSLDFSNVEFQDAVKYLKSQQKLELLIRKGAARDLFPGESSGYNSSSSSINGDIINEDITKVKLPAVQEELTQDKPSPDKILNITTEETEEIIQNETVTEEEEVHETMQSDENETETVREERKFSETVTQIKRVVTTVDVHQDHDLLEESDEDIIDSIRKVAEGEEKQDAEDKQRRDAETQTPTSEMSDEENSAKLLSIKLGNIWKEAAAIGNFHPQPPPMPQDEPNGFGLHENGERLATKKSINKTNAKTFPSKNEDMHKRQQHDLLIEEFKRVHKLMSESEENSNILPPPQGWESENEAKSNSRYPKMRQVTTKTTKSVTEETEEYTEVNSVIEPSTNANEVLYIDVGPELPSGVYTSQKSPERSPKPSNITDSKYEVPKPPEFFFPRTKPLVTIGTYQNTTQPRRIGFLQNPAVKIVTTNKMENGHSSNQINNPATSTSDFSNSKINESSHWIKENRFKPAILNGSSQHNVVNVPESDKFSDKFSSKFGPKVAANGNKVRELGNKIFQNGGRTSDWNSKGVNRASENDHFKRSDIVIHNGPTKSMAFIHTNGGLKDGEQNGIQDFERNKVKIQVKSDIPALGLRGSTTGINKRSAVKTKPPIIIEDLPRTKDIDILVEDFNPLKLFYTTPNCTKRNRTYNLIFPCQFYQTYN
uniref:PDZ domain-containing protein n=1 Tax=Strigamia maritima TaxID=126957 RepID=T1JE07_STRMM